MLVSKRASRGAGHSRLEEFVEPQVRREGFRRRRRSRASLTAICRVDQGDRMLGRWTILVVLLIVVVTSGCGGSPVEQPFDTAAPVEITSREREPRHFEDRTVCESGFTTGSDGFDHFSSCATRHPEAYLVDDKWFVNFMQCRNWAEHPRAHECDGRVTQRVLVLQYFYDRAQSLLGKRVRSVDDWTLVPPEAQRANNR